MKIRINLLLIAVAVFCLTNCSRSDSKDSNESSTEETVEVKKEKIDPGTTTDPESFNEEDAEAFSKLINKRKDIATPEALIRLYYNFPEEALETSTITVDSIELDSNQFLITLTHDGLLDDSLEGIKVVMTATNNDGIWLVTEVKRNWRCREGRGETGWGIESCS